MSDFAIVPELRFSTFNESWASNTLIKIAKNGFTNGVFNDPKMVGSGYKLINVKDMYRGNRINIEELTLLDIPINEFEKNKAQFGDIFFTRSSLVKEGIAWSNVMLDKSEDVTYDGHLIKMSLDTNEVNPYFFSKVLRTGTLRRQIVARGKTGTMTTIGQDDMATVVAYYPQPNEQQKIAAFLGSVDDKLNKLHRKRELLETWKRGLMQKIFSQQLRFTQDDGRAFPDWVEKKLGQLLTVRYGKDHKTLAKGQIPVFGTGGIMRYVDQSLHSGPSILIGRKGTIDKPQFVESPFWTVDTLFYSDITQGYVPFFVYLVVQSVNWKKYNEATGVPSLNAAAIHSVKIVAPNSHEEQQKIANFLSSIDNKIEAAASQITQTETFKKGLLQKMFV